MKLIRMRGEHPAVLGHLSNLGYRDKLLASIDDSGLHEELNSLLGAASAPGGDGPVAAALTSRRAEDVSRIPVEELRAAAPDQRLALLTIMLELSWSNAAEENRILDILESSGSGIGQSMDSVKGLGLKQRLFDHIDDESAKLRLTALLSQLHDPELDADLEVFNASALSNLGSGIASGLASAWEHASPGALVLGMLRPLIHPLDTLLQLFADGEQVLKDPSADGVIALLRDIFGTIGMWLLAASGLAAVIALALGAATVTAPAGAAVGGIAASLLTGAGWCGVIFVALAVVKLLIDLGEAGGATTRQEHEEESEQIGEDITTLAVVGLLAGLLKGVKLVIARIRGSTADPAKATPEELQKQADAAKKSQDAAAEESAKLKEAADKKSSGRVAGKKEGLYESADPARTPAEWEFKDSVKEDGPGVKVAETTFRSPSGAEGMARRVVNTKTGAIELQEIRVPPEAKWIKTDTPLVEGKGTPTASYLTMRLMQLVGVKAGSLKTLVVRDVWNLRAILELRKLLAEDPTLTREQAVMRTNTITSQETAVTQSGHRMGSARVTEGKWGSLKDVLDYWETRQEALTEPDPKIVEQHNATLREFGLTREQALNGKFNYDFDIEVSLEPLEGGGGGSQGGAPGVPPVRTDDND